MRRRRRYGGVVLAVPLLLAAGCTGGTRPAPALPPRSPVPAGAAATLQVTSPGWAEGTRVPEQYTCSGAGTSPALAISGVPARATALAVVVDDPDAPGGTFTHWIASLPVETRTVAAGVLPPGARQALNSAGTVGWTPVCPPRGTTHRYRLTVIALAEPPGLRPTMPPAVALAEVSRSVLARGTLTGTYRR